MSMITERYANQIVGTFVCFDRNVLTGNLPGICYAMGMESRDLRTTRSRRTVRWLPVPTAYGFDLQSGKDAIARTLRPGSSSLSVRTQPRVSSISGMRLTTIAGLIPDVFPIILADGSVSIEWEAVTLLLSNFANCRRVSGSRQS